MRVVDLVLSGTGVRLGVQIGAVKALRDYKYFFHRIIGTSGGAIVAAAIKCLKNIDDIEKIIKTIDFKDLICDGRFTKYLRLIRKNGLYKGDRFEKFIEKKITRGQLLKDQPDLYIVVSDISNSEPVVLNGRDPRFKNMKISRAVRLSMSAPLYWVPKNLKIDRHTCTIVDGGITANYYIDYFTDNTRPVIGINLYTLHEKKSRIKLLDYFKDILNTLMISNETEHIEDAYWSNTINLDTADIRPFDLDIGKEEVHWCISHGYCKTKSIIKDKIMKGICNG